MVRFNDKTQISSLASNDIMPITDMSDTTDDRKVTVQQLSQFTVDNIPTLSGGKTLTENNLTNTLKDNYDTAYENQDLTKYDSTVSYPKGYWVTGVVNDQKVVKESLVDGNLGNPLTDDTKWKDVSLGGAGNEICDIGTSLYIDESKGLRRWLNGQIVAINTNTQAFLTRLKQIKAAYPSAFTTEENWQAEKLLSVYGQVGKFVIADDESTVRLPAVVNIQGLLDLQNLGMRVDAGLPNITGSLNTGSHRVTGGNAQGGLIGGSGALGASLSHGIGGFNNGNGYCNGYNIDFDASRSNPIYGNSDTVQPEAIQYPYFIQIATGQETKAEIINELELNNPYTLFDSKYSETKLYNASWLRSEGQWNSKATHPKAYEALLVEQNAEIADGTTVELPSGTSYIKRGVSGGISAKLSTEEYDDYDFVVKTSDETFRLPLLNGDEKLAGNSSEDVSVPNTSYMYTAPKNGVLKGRYWSTTIGGFIQFENLSNSEIKINRVPYNTNAWFLYTDIDVKKGDRIKITYNAETQDRKFNFYPYIGNGSLYYYVGETVQNANLINAGRIEEKLTSIIPDNKELITSYGMPDYNSLISFSPNTNNTAPSAGMLLIVVNNYSEVSGKTYITINGIKLMPQLGGNDVGSIQYTYSLSKGDTYNFTTTSTLSSNRYYFIPLKGVN